MNILITGGTGLIGRKLIQNLTDCNITVLSRTPQKAQRLLGNAIKCITSLSDVDFNQIDVVINLAGEPIADKRWRDKQKAKIVNSRLEITQALCDQIRACDNPPNTFISGSAIGIYGRQSSDTVIDESFNHFYPEFSHQLCLQWEALAQSITNITRVCIIRTGIVLAGNGGALQKMLPSFRFGGGSVISPGTQMMSWIHIDDHIRAIKFLIENHGCEGIYNLTAPNPVSNRELSYSLAKTLNRPCMLVMPMTLMRLIFGELSDLLIYGQRVVPAKLLAEEFTFNYPELNGALDAIFHGESSGN